MMVEIYQMQHKYVCGTKNYCEEDDDKALVAVPLLSPHQWFSK